jgi:hypothetical protein
MQTVLKKMKATIPLVVWCFVFSAFHTPNPTAADKGFALVELFTSEGCSSCPAADEAVGRISFRGQSVFVLSFHVDYWDKYGWKDKYSSAAFSDRQQVYGNLFHLSSIYTPQIVVNGKVQFVGSDEKSLQAAIETSIKQVPAVDIHPVVLRPKQGRIAVSCGKLPGGNATLYFALVQDSASDFILRGENKGRKLHHYFIVRDFISFAPDKSKDPPYLEIPRDISVAHCSVIAFLQNSKTGQVLDAVQIPVPE